MKLFIVILTLISCCSSMDRNKKPIDLGQDNIIYKLEAKEYFSTGEPVKVQFILENRTDNKFLFQRWYTPFEGFNSDMFSITHNGKEIPYEGRMVKRGSPRIEDYLLIDPGNYLDTVLELSSVYNLKDTGVYQIKFIGKIYDFIYLTETQKAEKYFPRSSDSMQTMELSGNSLSLKIGTY